MKIKENLVNAVAVGAEAGVDAQLLESGRSGFENLSQALISMKKRECAKLELQKMSR